MSGSWSRGPQYHTAASPVGAPPLICFNCGQNHLLINCTLPKNQATAPFQPQAAPSYHQYPGPFPSPQQFALQGGPIQSSYQQYHQNQQYGTPAQSQYGYGQPPPQQSYSAPPLAVPYANPPDQAPPNNLYPHSSGPQQYGRPPQMDPSQQYGSQQYRPPQAVPYQAPSPAYPPDRQNSGYNDICGPPAAQYQGPPQQQWNNMQPPQSASGLPPYQLQKRSYSDVSGSSTPGFQRQSTHSFQRGNRTRQNQQPPQNADLVNNNHHSKPPFNRNAPATTSSQSKTSSASSTPFSQPTPSSVKPSNDNRQDFSNEDGGEDEFTEDQQFEWDMTWIFNEVLSKETVALAQPLSINFAMGPVPLMNTASTTSVSRYARKDNVKNFSQSIRVAPQWSFIKEDPAFAKLDMNSPLIPIEDIPSWVARRHGMVGYIESESIASRKRVRSGEGDETAGMEQGQVIEPATQEVVAEPQEASRAPKRQKNNECIENSEMRQGTPTLGADVHAARDGTPDHANDNNVWAPVPGESAVSSTLPEDPTEALLTSLGVTGAPKPVSPIPATPYQPLPKHTERPLTGQPLSAPLKSQIAPQALANAQRNVRPMRNPQSQPPNPRAGSQYAPPHNGSYGHGPHRNMRQNSGPPINPNFNRNQQQQAQFVPPGNAQYHNVPPPNTPYGSGNAPFMKPNHSQYGNGMNTHPQGAHTNQRPYNNGINGQPHSGNPNNIQHGSGTTVNYQSENSYGAPTDQGQYNGSLTNAQYNGPLNHQPGPEVQQSSHFFDPNANGLQNQQQYTPGPPPNQNPDGQQANGHFDGPPQQQHGPWPHQNLNSNHGNRQFNGPPNQEYGPGPQQNQNFSGQPSYNQGPGVNNGLSNGYVNSSQGPSQSANTTLAQSQYGPSMQNNGPVRQDSSYGKTNGSFNSEAAQNDRTDHHDIQSQSQEMPHPNGPSHHVNDVAQSNNDHDNTENHSVPYGKQGSAEAEGCTSGEHTQDGSPLSPMSQEILGKLAQPTRGTSRIKKRRAPNVDEVYSRRW